METKFKSVFLKLSQRQFNKLEKAKLNFSSFYGTKFTWEQYFLSIADDVNNKLKEITR